MKHKSQIIFRKLSLRDVPKSIYIAVVALVLSLILLVCSYVLTQDKQGTFTPPDFDPAAQSGVPDVPQELGWSVVWQEGMEFKPAICGVFHVRSNQADVWFTNLEGEAWLKLRVLDENGNLLGESGLIRPGEYLQTITLKQSPADGEAITLHIMAYEPQTYYSLGAVNLKTIAVCSEN